MAAHTTFSPYSGWTSDWTKEHTQLHMPCHASLYKWWWVFPCLRGFEENVNITHVHLFFIFFCCWNGDYLVHANSTLYAKISPQWLSKPRWLWLIVPWRVACELVYGQVPTLCLDSGIVSPLWLHWVKGVCLFRCNLPPTLLVEWLGSFTCHCSNTGMERTKTKSVHKVNSGEENSPTTPAGIRTHNLSIMSPALLPTSYPATNALLSTADWEKPVVVPEVVPVVILVVVPVHLRNNSNNNGESAAHSDTTRSQKLRISMMECGHNMDGLGFALCALSCAHQFLQSQILCTLCIPQKSFALNNKWTPPPPPLKITHIKDPVLHVRIWWIMGTPRHPACTG